MTSLVVILAEILSIAAIVWALVRIWPLAWRVSSTFETVLGGGTALAVALIVSVGAMTASDAPGRLAWLVGAAASDLAVVAAMIARVQVLSALGGLTDERIRRHAAQSERLRQRRWFRFLMRGRPGE